MTDRLVFVYNAKAGLFAGALDSIHKTLSPSTYACDLCALTYGALAMRPRWRDWLKSLPIQADFYHRSDFRIAYPAFADERLPLVAIVSQDGWSVLLCRDELSQLRSLDDLMSALQSKLKQTGSPNADQIP